jgi:hypothetical protein
LFVFLEWEWCYFLDPHLLINVRYTHPSLVFSPWFYLLLKYSLLNCFLLSNVGCRSHYYQIPGSTNPQSHVSILSHFSSFKTPTLSHFSSDAGVSLRETNMLLSFKSPCLMSCRRVALRMTHISPCPSKFTLCLFYT